MFDLYYKKNNNIALFESFKNLEIRNVQNFIPLYGKYFSLKPTNYRNMNLYSNKFVVFNVVVFIVVVFIVVVFIVVVFIVVVFIVVVFVVVNNKLDVSVRFDIILCISVSYKFDTDNSKNIFANLS